MENNCKFVSSYGIMKSCDIYSMNPSSSVITLVGYDFSKVFNGCSIYICNSAIPEFANKINDINSKFILVSGDCDETNPKDLFKNNNTFIEFIESDKIIHWYSQNCIIKHPKISQLPIGLDYHTMNNHSNHSWGKQMSPLEQEKVLISIRKNSKPFWNRTIKCYANFQFNINGMKYGYDRSNAINNINKELVYYEPTKKERKDNHITQSTYSFVISPHGNGLDCHRTWEALCLGCIPIVRTSELDSLYDDLPVLIVKNWFEVTQDLLNQTIINYKNTQFNYDKLLLIYWMNKFK